MTMYLITNKNLKWNLKEDCTYTGAAFRRPFCACKDPFQAKEKDVFHESNNVSATRLLSVGADIRNAQPTFTFRRKPGGMDSVSDEIRAIM